MAGPVLSSSPAPQVDARNVPVGLVHLALAMGGFAIGTTEFATMSLLPPWPPGCMSTRPPRAMSSAPMHRAW
jgi:hypothetical protein